MTVTWREERRYRDANAVLPFNCNTNRNFDYSRCQQELCHQWAKQTLNFKSTWRRCVLLYDNKFFRYYWYLTRSRKLHIFRTLPQLNPAKISRSIQLGSELKSLGLHLRTMVIITTQQWNFTIIITYLSVNYNRNVSMSFIGYCAVYIQSFVVNQFSRPASYLNPLLR